LPQINPSNSSDLVMKSNLIPTLSGEITMFDGVLSFFPSTNLWKMTKTPSPARIEALTGWPPVEVGGTFG
jgi:hypothetical protein